MKLEGVDSDSLQPAMCGAQEAGDLYRKLANASRRFAPVVIATLRGVDSFKATEAPPDARLVGAHLGHLTVEALLA